MSGVITVVLGVATLLGGFAAFDYFKEKRARKLAPNPLTNPTREEIERVVLESDPKNDWIRTQTQIKQIVSYRHNPILRCEHSLLEDGIQNAHFREHWANRHPDPDAAGYWYDLHFGPTLIGRFILVGVDGVRALIPTPSRADGFPGGITNQGMPLKVARIHDALGTWDEYIRRYGLDVAPNIEEPP
ncbi:MAG: hypothetical protein WDZ66_12160 [Steroidobacteraceae bacterium]